MIDRRHTGKLPLLDEQCIVPKSTDQKFCRYLYSRYDSHERFTASSAQRVDYKFSVEHYAGPVEYTNDSWLEKNKDRLPAAAARLLMESKFELIGEIRSYVNTEEGQGRGSVATKPVSAQFSSQLQILRDRMDQTVPHYIRCLKPNDDLVPDHFEPKSIVEQLCCGGVLEAVRVSQAGYPTRCPHDIFMGGSVLHTGRSGGRQSHKSHQPSDFLGDGGAQPEEIDWEDRVRYLGRGSSDPIGAIGEGTDRGGGPHSQVRAQLERARQRAM